MTQDTSQRIGHSDDRDDRFFADCSECDWCLTYHDWTLAEEAAELHEKQNKECSTRIRPAPGEVTFR